MSHKMIGKPAPPLTLPSTPTGDPYTLPIGQQAIALFFFPKAGTAGCTMEACSFRDARAKNEVFKRCGEGLLVVGVSGDPTIKQSNFVDEHELGYPVLCDADGSARKAYGVSKAAFGLIEGRETFFIDAKGIIRDVCTDAILYMNHTKMVEKNLKKLEAEQAGKA